MGGPLLLLSLSLSEREPCGSRGAAVLIYAKFWPLTLLTYHPGACSKFEGPEEGPARVQRHTHTGRASDVKHTMTTEKPKRCRPRP